MSEGNVFGQPPKPDWTDEKAEAVHDEWAREQFVDERRAFRLSVQDLADERERLVSERSYLISLGADPDDLEPIDGAEATKTLHEAHPLLKAEFGPLPSSDPPHDPSEYHSPFPPPLSDLGKQKVIDEAPKAKYEWDRNARGKDSNPKDAIGSRKAGLSMLPRQVLYEVALGMLEGALKYARHNYRIAGVRASVYMDANSRHMDAWWEGQDIDPGSGLHHVVKAIASLVVLRDSMLAGNWHDDRAPSIGDPNWLEWYNAEAARIIDEFEGEPKQPFIKGDNE